MSAAHLFERPAFLPDPGNLTAWRGRRIGLTGGRGVLGSLLRERLAAAGVETDAYGGDVGELPALTSWFSGRAFSHLFHFAALVPVGAVEADPVRAYETNVVGTFNVCRLLAETQPDCWLFQCSSSHVYRPAATREPLDEMAATIPATFYGDTKLAAERVVSVLLGKLQRPYCIGRVFSFTHPRQRPPYLVPSLREQIAALAEGATLEIQNPSSVRDIQDADYVIDAILNLAARRAQGIVNIGTGTGCSVRDIALRVAHAAGRHVAITGVDREPPGSLIADTARLRSLLST